jgi:UDPglucose 6-dehydrogenase
MIGIIGYGMVGKAVEYGFSKVQIVISDPAYNSLTVRDLAELNPEAIFVCVPTPTDDSNYSNLISVLDELQIYYSGLVIVKSTVPPSYLEKFDIVFNPEFLSRATSLDDFVNPQYLILAGTKAKEAEELYNKYSTVKTEHTFIVDIPTAALIKYTMNCFYALKITYMNSIYDIANQVGADYNTMTTILSKHPWMGSHHFQVPGPDGQRGFGGPCLPKDTEAMIKEFDFKLLADIASLNIKYRNHK